jgi:hypothetical protein
MANLVSLCYRHHRAVELGTWTVTPAPPGHTSPWTLTRN